jgi:organic radical activating enzyme
MKPRLTYSELNITNVCNYSCTHCQSFNNYAFKGHQRWNDYKDKYELLSKQIDIDIIQLIGGEPTLNPDFYEWLDGVSKLWPKSKLQIATNGTSLEALTEDVYNVLARNNGTLWVTCHDINLYDSFLEFVKKFLDVIISDTGEAPVRKVSRIFVDKNGVEVILDWTQTFRSSAVDLIDNKLTMKYNSNPIEAHNNCGFKNCHQMNKGKLYKCPLVSVLPDFLDQFNVTVSDKELAYAYKPMSHDDADVKKFVNELSNHIPQCKFCPSNYNTGHNFIGTDKKIKIIPF